MSQRNLQRRISKIINYEHQKQEFEKKSKTDVVYISLINALHYYWAKKFLENNYHVIIDKPATLNFKQAKNLVKFARIKKITF